MTTPLLLLWDIDGTLLQRASLEHADALHAALVEVHGELSLEGHQIEAAAGVGARPAAASSTAPGSSRCANAAISFAAFCTSSSWTISTGVCM